MTLKILGGNIINPAGALSGNLDILIENGKVKDIGENVGEADSVINAAGLTVFPGFIDLHCHLREPGQEYKEDIMSGTKAAAKGGYTAVCCMPNTSPVMDNASVVALVQCPVCDNLPVLFCHDGKNMVIVSILCPCLNHLDVRDVVVEKLAC